MLSKARRTILAFFAAISFLLQPINPVSSIAVSPTVLEVGSWASNSSRLSASQSRAIQNWLASQIKGDPIKVECVGWFGAKATAKVKNLAKSRAATACAAVKGLVGISGLTLISTNRVTSKKSLTNFVRLSLSTQPKAYGSDLVIPVDQCKISAPSKAFNLSTGFPRPQGNLPYSGVVKALFVPLDFPDYPGVSEINGWAPGIAKSLHDYYAAMSYGKIDFQVTVLPKYVRMKMKVNEYGLATQAKSPMEFNAEAFNSAADNFDISGFDVAYTFVSPETPVGAITWGGAFSNDITTKDGVITNYSGPGLVKAPYGRPLNWIAHETGHLFGFPDLYNRTIASAVVREGGASRFGHWDIMSSTWNEDTQEMIGWFRFLVGWLPDSDVVCFDGSKALSSAVYVNSISGSNGPRLVLIRLSDTEVLAVEKRSASTFAKLNISSSLMPGLLVYYIDGNRSLQKAPLEVVPKEGGTVWNLVVRENGTTYNDPLAVSATLGTNDNAFFRNITVSNLFDAASSTLVGVEIK